LKSLVSTDVKITNTDNADLQIFKNWIGFLELSETQQKEYSIKKTKKVDNTGQNFEKDVQEWLSKQSLDTELEIVTKHPIGSYVIDLAIFNKATGKFLLGLEIDGLKEHLTALQKYGDVVRQDFIKVKGYELIRISEILWKTDKNKVLQMIKEKIVV
jgi:very-short-patch-repair endonuclease